MDTALLYVSRRLVPCPDLSGAIVDIMSVSRVRNAMLDVTGALIATRAAFAQWLEGPPRAVETLVDSIRRDCRHSALRVLTEAPVSGRRFNRWALVYWGPSTFVAGHVEPLVQDQNAKASDHEGAHRLLSLMQAFHSTNA